MGLFSRRDDNGVKSRTNDLVAATKAGDASKCKQLVDDMVLNGDAETTEAVMRAYRKRYRL